MSFTLDLACTRCPSLTKPGAKISGFVAALTQNSPFQAKSLSAAGGDRTLQSTSCSSCAVVSLVGGAGYLGWGGV